MRHDPRRTEMSGATWRALAAAALFTLPAAGFAAEQEHGAHVHGVSQLNIAAEGNAVQIELISPGADIVGFEHRADTAEDKRAVAAAVLTLKDGGALFVFPPDAGCRLAAAEVEAPHEDEHGHGHTGNDDKGEAHSEFHAEFRFACDRPDRLTHLDVKLFERFPGMKEIKAQVVSARGQLAQELTRESTRLRF
jgi:hypothetical protein